MRSLAAVSIAFLVLLAGCSASLGPSNTGTGSGQNETSAAPATSVMTSSTTAGAGETGGSAPGTTGTGTESAQRTSAVGTTGTETGTGTGSETLADPPSDRLGWENGIWYNESLPIDATDGLNATERGEVVNRTMARIEVIRRLEYTDTVPVTVISRAKYQRQAGGGGPVSDAYRTFDNGKFEAMFLVGEDQNSLAVQRRNRGSSVLGYYSPQNDSIVIVSDSPTPQLSPGTLAHELTHALQDQRFDLTDDAAPTRDAYNARNGLIEGEGNLVERKYQRRFDDAWATQATNAGASNGNGNGNNGSGDGEGSGSGSGSNQLNYGIQFLEYFPYSDGPGFVASLYDRGGWEAVNAAEDDLPASSEQVIYPRKYERDAPQNVTVRDTSAAEWHRVTPRAGAGGAGPRPGYAVLGQSALSSMFAYTIAADNGNRRPVIEPRTFLNVGPNGEANRSDPYNYGFPATEGWDGDKLYVYENDAGKTGYVWKLVWDSPRDANEFGAAYRSLLRYWGGTQVASNDAGAGTTSTWRIDRASPFTDAFRVHVEGTSVTITNAPTRAQLNGVHSG